MSDPYSFRDQDYKGIRKGLEAWLPSAGDTAPLFGVDRTLPPGRFIVPPRRVTWRERFASLLWVLGLIGPALRGKQPETWT